MAIPFLYKHDGVTELLFHRRGGIDGCGTTELMNAVKVMPRWQLGLPKAARIRIEREIEPQGPKPSSFAAFAARLKSCPDTKFF
jgi:hypothetical protein